MAKKQIKKWTLIDNAIKALDTLAEAYPKAVLAIETPSGYVSVSLSSAIIYAHGENVRPFAKAKGCSL